LTCRLLITHVYKNPFQFFSTQVGGKLLDEGLELLERIDEFVSLNPLLPEVSGEGFFQLICLSHF